MSTTKQAALTLATLDELAARGFNTVAVSTRHGRRYEYKLIDGAWCLFGKPKKLAFICRHAEVAGRWSAWG